MLKHYILFFFFLHNSFLLTSSFFINSFFVRIARAAFSLTFSLVLLRDVHKRRPQSGGGGFVQRRIFRNLWYDRTDKGVGGVEPMPIFFGKGEGVNFLWFFRTFFMDGTLLLYRACILNILKDAYERDIFVKPFLLSTWKR